MHIFLIFIFFFIINQFFIIMKKQLLSLLTVVLLPFLASAADYCTYTGNVTRTDRGITKLTMSDGTNTAEVAGRGTSGSRPVYLDATETVFTTTPGAEVTLTVAGSGEWMHEYLYIDYNNDGTFTPDLDPTNNAALPTSELVSFNSYGLNGGESSWFDSKGTSVTNHFNIAGTLPTFTIPADLAAGDYRVRFVDDWNSIDPCGHPTQSGNALTTNGGFMIDFTLRIEATETPEPAGFTMTVTVNGEGTAVIKDANDNVYESGVSKIDPNAVVSVWLTPAEGWHLAKVLWGGDAFETDEVNLNDIENGQFYAGWLDCNQTLDVTFEQDAVVEPPVVLEPTYNETLSGADYEASTSYADYTFEKYNATWKANLVQSITGILQFRYQARATGTNPKDPSGFVMTAKREGSKLEKIILHWFQGTSGTYKNVIGRTVQFWAKDEPYEAIDDIYSSVSATKGTQLDGGCTFGTFGDDNTAVNNLSAADYNNDVLQIPTYDTEFVVPEAYQEKYIAFRPTSGAAYLTSIELVYVDPDAPVAPTMYTVNIAEVENGTITVMNGETAVANGDEVEENTVLNITATAAEGYELEAVTVNGTALEGETYTVTGETTIAATFTAVAAPAPKDNVINKPSYNQGSRQANRVRMPWSVVGKAPLAGDGANADEDYAVGFWYKATSIRSGGGQLFKIGTPSHANLNGHVFINVGTTGELNFQVVGGDNQNAPGARGTAPTGSTASLGTYALNAWHYVLVSINNTAKNLSVYVDAEKKMDLELDCPVTYYWGDATFQFMGWGFGGQLDQVEFYNDALAPAEARQAIQDPTKVAKLSAFYTFNEQNEDKTFSSEFVENEAVAVWENCRGTATWATEAVDCSFTNLAADLVETDRVPTVLAELQKYNVYVARPEMGSFKLWANGQEIENDSEVEEGTEVTVETIAPEGYELEWIKVNGTEIEGNKFVVSQATTVLIKFKLITYALTVSVPEGATYEVYVNQELATEEQLAAIGHGKAVSFRLIVPEGEEIETFTVNGETAEYTFNNEYYFTNFTMTAETAIVVTFKAHQFFHVTTGECENGSVAVFKGTAEVTAETEIGEGTTVNVVATPAEGYELVTVLVNGEPIEGTSFEVTADAVVTATFQEKSLPDYCTHDGSVGNRSGRNVTKITVTDGTTSTDINGMGGSSKVYVDRTSEVATVAPGSTLTVTTTGNGEWMHGYIYIDYNQDHVFTPIIDNEGIPQEGGELVSFNYYQPNRINTTEENPYGGGSGNYYNSKGESFTDAHANIATTLPTFTLPADLPAGDYRMRYKCDWSSIDPCGNKGHNESGKSGLQNKIESNSGMIIDFILRIEKAEPYTVTIANPDELGKVEFVSPETTETTVTTDEVVTVKASTELPDVYFVNWTDAEGNEVSNKAEFTYTGLADITLNANFEVRYSVTYNATEGGSINVNSRYGKVESGSLLKLGTEVTITVKTDAGKQLTYLSLNNEDITEDFLAEESFTFTLEESAVIEAEFDDVQWKLNAIYNSEEGVVVACDAIDEATAMPEGEPYAANATFADGTDLYIVAYANEHYKLMSFEVDGDVYLAEGRPGDADQMDITHVGNAIALFYAAFDDINVTATFQADGAGLDSIAIDNLGNAEIFNLQGIRVARENVVPGIYIIRANNEAHKVYVK